MTKTITVNRNIDVWKEIEGFPGYEISRDGRVWSNINNIFLKPGIDTKGYKFVNIRKERGKFKMCRIHVLVLNAFIGKKPSKKYVCNHKNSVRTDNFLINLKSCDFFILAEL